MSESQHRGFTLIEVLVAVFVLGSSLTALFGLFSRSLVNLRKLEDAHHYQLAAQSMLNRVLLLPSLPPGGHAEGSMDRMSLRWVVDVDPWIPRTLDGHPAEAVMKINVEIVWPGRTRNRSIHLETIEPARISYSNYDFSHALEQVFPR